MGRPVTIYGKDTWPYTTNAREAYASEGCDVAYHDVTADRSKIKEMLSTSGGRRDVPVIVDGEKVTIGYGGSWGI